MSVLRSAVVLFVAVCPSVSLALTPRGVFVVTNKNVEASRKIAEHYCKLRKVPAENIVALDVPDSEDISREQFNTRIHAALRDALAKKKEQAKVLLTIYGVPLRVGPDQASEEEKKELAKVREQAAKLQKQKNELQESIDALKTNQKTNESQKQKIKSLEQKRDNLQKQIRFLQQRQRYLSHAESVASVDSELMLLWWPKYELRRWQPNLLNFRIPDNLRTTKPPVLMVSRLDGPTPELVMGLIDDAVAVEHKGLNGKVYVDARGITWNKKSDTGYGYGGYDESLREMAKLFKTKTKLQTILDDKGPLFKSQSCNDTALYCGWYSLAKYVDCCKFVKGAVAYHIASSEARSLRNAKAKYWCPNLLKDGVVATLGPVAEPYTIGFPKPAEFFGFLATGKYTLVECYSKTVLLNSWMTVLVGDPLYNPYAKSPQLQVEDVAPSPAGSPFLFGPKK